MPWCLTSLGHQHVKDIDCMIGRSLSFLMHDSNYLIFYNAQGKYQIQFPIYKSLRTKISFCGDAIAFLEWTLVWPYDDIDMLCYINITFNQRISLSFVFIAHCFSECFASQLIINVVTWMSMKDPVNFWCNKKLLIYKLWSDTWVLLWYFIDQVSCDPSKLNIEIWKWTINGECSKMMKHASLTNQM